MSGPDYAIAFGRHLRASKTLYPPALTDEAKRNTWDILEQYQDKQWSYVACSLLAVAQRLNIRRVFAFDYHFQQMELEVLP